MVKYCSKCGNKLEDNDKFCDECGTPSTEPKLSGSISNNIKKLNRNNNELENKFNKKIILVIIAIIVIIGIVVVAGGFLESKTTYDFDTFTLTLSSSYAVESSNSFSAKIYDTNNVAIGTVNGMGCYIVYPDWKEVTIGGHKGYIDEKTGRFQFEENNHTFDIQDSNWVQGNYNNIEIIAEGVKVK